MKIGKLIDKLIEKLISVAVVGAFLLFLIWLIKILIQAIW